ncbi:pectinesterase family protein [Kaistella palustris]|uniref:pectinesterase family protein n=1 Tax=Kaistella palustris TaxID=493376 RepID=UPI000420AE65|nr:pectinesterase family protein [Kaistella palustris]
MKRFFLYSFVFLISSLVFAQEKDTLVVAKDGSGDYTSVQQAIDNTKAFPENVKTIYIKKGIYKEKVKLHAWNPQLHLVGESRDSTVISFDDHFSKINLGRNSTFFTPTLSVEADDAVVKNLTIENTAGDIGQAIALSLSGDRTAVLNCRILGNQDTLYVSGGGTQFFKDCYIAGTTDFIFGNATAFFENCEIFSKKDSFITAASTPRENAFGLVFRQCRFTAVPDVSKVFLGRPWRTYAKTAVLNSYLGSHILAEGWDNWNNKTAEKTSYYAEFKNEGPGAATGERVKWSHRLRKKEALRFAKEKVLRDDAHPLWFRALLP